MGDECRPDGGSVLSMYSSDVCLFAVCIKRGCARGWQPFQFTAVGGGLDSNSFRVSVSIEAKSVHVAVVVDFAKRQGFNTFLDDNTVLSGPLTQRIALLLHGVHDHQCPLQGFRDPETVKQESCSRRGSCLTTL